MAMVAPALGQPVCLGLLLSRVVVCADCSQWSHRVGLLSNLAREGKSPALGRWFASNCFAAIAALQLMLPLVPQLQSYMQTEEARATIGLSWVFNTAMYFLAGVPWSKGALATSSYLELMPYAIEHPAFFVGIVAAIVGLILVGYVAMFRLPLPEGPIVAAGSWLILSDLPQSSFGTGSSNGISFISCRAGRGSGSRRVRRGPMVERYLRLPLARSAAGTRIGSCLWHLHPSVSCLGTARTLWSLSKRPL